MYKRLGLLLMLPFLFLGLSGCNSSTDQPFLTYSVYDVDHRFIKVTPIHLKLVDEDLKFAFVSERGTYVDNYRHSNNYSIEIDDTLQNVEIEYPLYTEYKILKDGFAGKVISRENVKTFEDFDSSTPIVIRMSSSDHEKIFGKSDVALK